MSRGGHFYPLTNPFTHLTFSPDPILKISGGSHSSSFVPGGFCISPTCMALMDRLAAAASFKLPLRGLFSSSTSHTHSMLRCKHHVDTVSS